MLSLLLAATLAAAPVPALAPRAVSSASTVVHIPRLDKLTGIGAFMSRAGAWSTLARPSTWTVELHPFLTLDPLHPESLAALGLDASGSATLSYVDHGKVSCTQLKDAKAFQAKAAEALSTGGPLKSATAQGLTTASAPRGTGRAGYVLKGQEACSFATLYDDDDLLHEAMKLLGKAPAADARLGKLPGALFLLQGSRVVGVDGSAEGLQAEGTATQLPLPPFQSSSPSPYGAFKQEGLLFSRAQVAPSGLSQAVGSVRFSIQQLCPACPSEQVEAIAQAVTKQLTGHVLVLVDSVQVKGSLRTPEGRFFALHQALAAQLKDAAQVKAALAPLASFPGAQALEDGYALELRGGTVFVRLKGSQLVLGNDKAVVQSVLDSLDGKSARLPHAVDFSADPKRMAKALSQVSLLDVVASQQLAGLFAISSELGLLLSNSEHLSGWLDSAPAATHRFSLSWTLPTPTPKP